MQEKESSLLNNESDNISNYQSFNGFYWTFLKPSFDLVKDISDSFNISSMMAKVIINRGVNKEDILNFINPKLKNLLPDPFILSDMDKAVDRIISAIENKEKIGIFGDYDVDGATSSAIIYKFLTMAGVSKDNIIIHIPDRMEEGYGLNINSLQDLKNQGCTLSISVDCGITAVNEVKWAMENELDMIVIDHHNPEGMLPEAIAVINPKKQNEKYDYSYLAACGVCFFTITAINKKLKELNYYKKNNIEEPNLILLLDLVALGTVCDVVPAISVNRAFIRTGLQVMANRTNLGLKALCDISGISTDIDSYHLGFVLGPRINAGGRVGDSSIGVKLLCSKNPITANNFAEILNEYNNSRREIEAKCSNEALEKINIDKIKEDKMIFISGKDWHTGVIGIVSGRIKERHNLPTFVSTVDEKEGIANGSARSVPSINIGEIIIKAKEKGIIIEGGGHYMAAGFTYKYDREKEFCEFLKDEIKKQLDGKEFKHYLTIDAVIDASAVNINFAKELKQLSPFGEKNPEPLFMISNMRLVKSEIIKNEHIKCVFTSDNGKSLYVMAFKAINTKMGDMFINHIGKTFNLIGKIRINTYKGIDSANFCLEDANFTSNLIEIYE